MMKALVEQAELEVLLDARRIEERVRSLGEEIAADYAERQLLLVCILKGSLVFFADLCRNIPIPARVDTLAVSSYHGGTSSSGAVRFVSDLRESIEGLDVLLVEDIVDTGLTINHLTRVLAARNPASLRVATLLDKPSRRKVEVDIAYRGFEIPDRFVVGYGLDYMEYFRNLPDVCVLGGPAALLAGCASD